MALPELREVCLRLSLSMNETPPWWNPLPGQDPFNGGPEPLSLFWQIIWYSGSVAGVSLFIWFLMDKVIPEAMDWLKTIKPFLKRSWQEYKEWKKD